MSSSDAPSCALPSRDPKSYKNTPDLAFMEGMKAELYSKPTCPHCLRAIDILCDLKTHLKITDVSHDEALRWKVAESVGDFPTVPMIFIKGKFVGGCSDLEAKLQDPSAFKAWLSSE